MNSKDGGATKGGRGKPKPRSLFPSLTRPAFSFRPVESLDFSKPESTPSASDLDLRSTSPQCSSISPPRLNGSSAKCSISDADLQLNDVTSHDEDEEASSSTSACSSSVIHLKSDILEANSFNLLSKRSYVDRVLISLPVLTEEEQKTLAATPAHPAGLYALYANCLAGNLVEQRWNFAWPAAIALIHPSLLPVAVMSFFTKGKG